MFAARNGERSHAGFQECNHVCLCMGLLLPDLALLLKPVVWLTPLGSQDLLVPNVAAVECRPLNLQAVRPLIRPRDFCVPPAHAVWPQPQALRHTISVRRHTTAVMHPMASIR